MGSFKGRDYKSGQERLQIKTGITNRGRDYKSEQEGLQISAVHVFHWLLHQNVMV